MTLNFAMIGSIATTTLIGSIAATTLIGSIAATTLKFVSTLERKND